MDAPVREHVNLSVEEVFEVLTEPHEIEKGASGLHLYQQIQVAIRAILSSNDRAEQTDIAGAVGRRDSQNLVPFVLEVHRVFSQ